MHALVIQILGKDALFESYKVPFSILLRRLSGDFLSCGPTWLGKCLDWRFGAANCGESGVEQD